MKKLVSLVLALAMVAVLGLAFADPATHTISTNSTTHTYQIYQVFTGTYDSTSNQLQDLKYGANAVGTTGDSVTETDMAAIDAIAKGTYANDQARITALSPYVDLTSTPIATIGKDQASNSATLAEGYYMIKDLDDSLEDPENYTLYLFGTLSADQVIAPKSSTTTVDKTVTETDDTAGTTADGQKGADYDEGDSIPYSIDITLSEKVHDFKTYSVTLTDTLSDGLTPPAANAVTVTFTKADGTTAVPSDPYGTPTVTVTGQVITVSYSYGNGTTAIGTNDLDGAVINVSYEAVLNSSAVKGVEGNPNTYSIEYTNNPNGSDTGETPDREVKVYTYDLNITKVDGNGEPLQGAAFTLYKEVTSEYTGAQTGSAIKATLATGVDASKLDNAKYYVPVTMTEAVTRDAENNVTAVTHSTDTTIDAGSYVLIETTVPAGYNAYAGENITITSTINAAGELTGLTAEPQTLTVSSNKADVNGSVTNNSGATLPSTGGIGTTIFYIVGGILLIGAAVILVARRKAHD